jgi:2-amino-4-hydroxy-6-hydroxymethyldihydropteridine diphosphokinase
MRAGVALGSNLSDRLQHLRMARQAMIELEGVTPPVLASAIYETEPVDCEEGAGKFLNAVVEFGYEGKPAGLWQKLREIEASLGRPGDHARNISRKIDLDLLYFAEMKIVEGSLQLPHPRLHLRRFVLQPLADIRADLILPGQTKTVRELLASLAPSARVERLTNNWEPE